jgi:amino acid transporter
MEQVAMTGTGVAQPGDQGLKRKFGFWTSFGVGFTFISPVVGLYSIIGIATFAAGPMWVLTLPVVLFGATLIALIFAELASAFPIAGGIYQWSRRLGGTKYGWFAGWIYVWTIALGIGANCYFGSLWLTELLGISPSPGGQVLWALVVLAAVTFSNLAGHRVLSFIVNLGLAAELLGSVVVGLVLLIAFRHHPVSSLGQNLGASAHFGGSVMGSMLAAAAIGGWAFLGFDAAGTLSEEVQNPRRAVPRAMICSLLGVGVLIILNASGVTLSFPHLGSVITGQTTDPITPTVTASFGSWASGPLQAVAFIAFLVCSSSIQASTMRVIYSLSRDGVIPGSRALARTDKRGIPVPALVVSVIVSVGVICLGLQSVAFSTMLALIPGTYYLCFVLVVGVALWARLRNGWRPNGPFNLGRWSLPVTILAGIWAVGELINIAWPRPILDAVGAPFYQVWAVLLIGFLIIAVGAVYFLISRPDRRTRSIEELDGLLAKADAAATESETVVSQADVVRTV